MKPFLSIIVPCYNCENTIGRLLDSIVQNNMSKDDLQVIICDDKSTDNFLSIAKTYEDKLNIDYCETYRDFHCPGNTRNASLPYILGEWFTFIDHDDMFEPNVLLYVKNFIQKNNLQYTLVTNFREYNIEKNKYTKEFTREDADTWLHGKFFNTQHTLKDFNCHFYEDLFSHEDLYFNSVNLGNLISNGMDYDYLDIYTYKWVYNPQSLSRSYFNKIHYYIETYLGDYIFAASEPFLQLYQKDKKHKDFYINQIIMTLLHAYFYYQASIWRLGNKRLSSKIEDIHKLKVKIHEVIKMNDFDIINFIYSDPNKYENIKRNCEYGTCRFVETQSFRDFILNV